MLHRLSELEKLSKALEPDAEERALVREEVITYAEKFVDTIDELPAFVTTEKKGADLLASPLSESPADIHSLLRLVAENVDTPGLNPASGGHLGYIPGGGLYYSSLADYLVAITNRYAGTFYAAPGAVRMENMLLRWMAGIAGYPENAAGNLTSGGSIANLIAIVSARDARRISSQEIPRTVVYLSSQVHHCVDKALRIAGLAECIVRHLPLDENCRIIPEELEKNVVADREKNLNPWLVIASAGTTNTGSVDPLKTIGKMAQKYGLWYHIDGAYGAFFALCETGKKKLEGMELSDSIVMDPHKTLFLPYGTGTVLVKEPQHLFNAHHYLAPYLQDILKSQDELSPADLSPELTKHFRGLRMWLPLKLHGIAPFRAAVEEKLLLAEYFYRKIRNTPGFETGPSPDLSVVLFRYLPQEEDADRFNERLTEEVQRDGRIFFSSTRLNGNYMLRLAIVSFRTHRSTVDLAYEVLMEKIKGLIGRFEG